MPRRTRNPSVSPVLIVGGLAGVAALVWWATRSTAVATTQALVGGAVSQVTPALAYTGDVQGRVLTDAEADALGRAASLTQAVSPAVARSAALTAAVRQMNDPTLSAQTREAAARLVDQLSNTIA